MKSTLQSADLVFCGATLMDAPLADKISAACAGGFGQLSLWSHDYRRAREAGHSDADLRLMLDDHGLRLAGVDCLLNWLPGDAVPPGEYFAATEDDLYRVADALGGGWINVAQAFGSTLDREVATVRFAAICDRAARHGLAVTLEFIPWAGIRDLAVARTMVDDSGAGNARIAIDSWHFFRGGNRLEALADMDPLVFDNLQLNDARAVPAAELAAEAGERLLPGEGELPVVELVRSLLDLGVDTAWGIEASASRWSGMSPAEVGRRCGNAMRATLAAAYLR